MTGSISWWSVGLDIQRSWAQIPHQSKFSDFDYPTLLGVYLLLEYHSRVAYLKFERTKPSVTRKPTYQVGFTRTFSVVFSK